MKIKSNRDRSEIIFILFFLGLAFATWTASLSAQTEDKEEAGEEVDEEAKKEAKNLFFKGVLLFDEGKYASALEKFTKSYDLHPRWKTLYNIGMCYLELNDLPSAASMLSQFLEVGAGKIKKELAEQVAGILKDLKSKLGIVRLTGHYEGGVLTIDGVENSMGAEGKDVFLTPGVHHVKLARGEDVLVDKKITIEGGEKKEIFVVETKPSEVEEEEELPPEDEVVEKEEEPLPDEEESKKPIKKLKSSGWALFGVTLAFLAAGTVTGSLALVGKNDVVEIEDRYLRDFDELSAQELEALKKDRHETFTKAMNNSIASSIFFGLAGASAVVSVILLPLAYKKTATEKKANLDLLLAPDSVGISYKF